MDYQNKLDDIKNSNTYDELEMSGSRAVWPEVLSIYAVKTTNDPDNPQEVASMTDEKKQLLKDIFWEMNEISYETEEKTETVIVETDDGEGNIIEEEVEETTVYLYITVCHKTVEEMMVQYGFTEDQKAQVAELLAQDSSMWASVLYGIYGADDQIVTVALSQLGNVGGEPYWSGTVSALVLSGAPALSLGAPISAVISRLVLFPNMQAASTALTGSRIEASGQIMISNRLLV